MGVDVRKQAVKERQSACTLDCAQAVALTYFVLDMRCKIPVFETSKMMINGYFCKLYIKSIVIQITRAFRTSALGKVKETRYTECTDKCGCMVNSDIGTSDCVLLLLLQVCGQAYVQSHVSLSMD